MIFKWNHPNNHPCIWHHSLTIELSNKINDRVASQYLENGLFGIFRLWCFCFRDTEETSIFWWWHEMELDSFNTSAWLHIFRVAQNYNNFKSFSTQNICHANSDEREDKTTLWIKSLPFNTLQKIPFPDFSLTFRIRLKSVVDWL